MNEWEIRKSFISLLIKKEDIEILEKEGKLVEYIKAVLDEPFFVFSYLMFRKMVIRSCKDKKKNKNDKVFIQ